MSRLRSKRDGERRWPLRVGTVLLGLAAAVALATPAAAEPVQWTVYAGSWGVEKRGAATELGIEFQRPLKYAGFDLIGGLAGTDDEAVWVYLGTSYSWEPNAKWRFRPSFAVSLFEDGDGKDLGGPVEFRSSLEATYQLRNKVRLGLMVYHLSNAGFYDLNPGANSLVFVVGF